MYPTETEIYVRGNQDFVYDTQKQYTLDLVCEDLRRSDSSYFYVYLLRNMPPSFTNLQGNYFCILFSAKIIDKNERMLLIIMLILQDKMWFTFTHDKHAETVEFIVVRNKIIMKKTQVYEAYVVHIKF